MKIRACHKEKKTPFFFNGFVCKQNFLPFSTLFLNYFFILPIYSWLAITLSHMFFLYLIFSLKIRFSLEGCSNVFCLHNCSGKFSLQKFLSISCPSPSSNILIFNWCWKRTQLTQLSIAGFWLTLIPCGPFNMKSSITSACQEYRTTGFFLPFLMYIAKLL